MIFIDFLLNHQKIEILQEKLMQDNTSRKKQSTMNDIIKAIQKHEVEVASQAIDKLVEKIHEVLTDQDADLLENLEQYLSDIVTSVKDVLKEDSKKAAKVATGKKVKDPNAPKRPPSEYNIFVKKHIEMLKEQKIDAKPKEMMSMAVKAWNEEKEKNAATGNSAKGKAKPHSVPDSDEEASEEDVEIEEEEKKPAKKGGKK